MALEQHNFDQENTYTEECEAIIDMEGELISSLEEISRLKKKEQNKKIKVTVL